MDFAAKRPRISSTTFLAVDLGSPANGSVPGYRRGGSCQVVDQAIIVSISPRACSSLRTRCSVSTLQEDSKRRMN